MQFKCFSDKFGWCSNGVRLGLLKVCRFKSHKLDQCTASIVPLKNLRLLQAWNKCCIKITNANFSFQNLVCATQCISIKLFTLRSKIHLQINLNYYYYFFFCVWKYFSNILSPYFTFCIRNILFICICNIHFIWIYSIKTRTVKIGTFKKKNLI